MLKKGMNTHNIASQALGTPVGFQNHFAKYYENFLMANAMNGQLPPELLKKPGDPEQNMSLYKLLERYKWA